MKQGKVLKNSELRSDEAKQRVCRDFERAWHADPDFRIEGILESVRDTLESAQTNSNRAQGMGEVLAELIHVEMDLRHGIGQTIDTVEYEQRFPDYVSIIRRARQRLENPDQIPDKGIPLVSGTVLTKCLPGDPDDDDVDLVIDQEGHQVVPDQLGPYRDIAEIGSGGFGVVCRAVDSRDGREVALKFPRRDKLPDESHLKLFLEEASKAMELDHPGIVRTWAVEQADGYLAIVQQLIDGTNLKTARDDPRSNREIAEIVAQVADALAYANRQGIVHRDLKPGNILLDRDGRPYIADFGLAMHESEQIYLPNQTCGTTPYMSPQQAAGLTRHLDGRSDIWSLGVILYELLTGKRPFRGLTVMDVIDQIENRDPRPLREIDPSIDRELQRICLKCLSRYVRDRYMTADELAEDLRHWIGQSDSPGDTEADVNFVPKGLRSYGPEDSAFFLELLPGPIDRNGLPASIRFWRTRIREPVDSENRVPVGVIYGPSGSGKSSFVKAGLLPQIRSTVSTIYVEATRQDTEVRMIKALRRQFPEIPDDISLPELFFGLQQSRWQSGAPKKILIVLDQFEQRLSLGDEIGKSQLVRGLRHCDGETLQCVVLARDDFLMALTRFADALEMDLREGENSQAIDLFDRDHAKRVLIKLGRAYDRLPTEGQELPLEAEEFLDRAVEHLAVNGFVICVRLTLFAEMFRTRPWTLAELRSVGGVSGVGEKFLETTFGSESSNRRYRQQRESVEKILEALLPDRETDIRGSMKPEQELIAAAQPGNRPEPIRDLIRTLDSELKLITRTDPDVSGDSSPSRETNQNDNSQVWYQLTHDYLVPSVRSWLETTLGKSRGGRARLQLRELAAQTVPGHSPKYLPSNPEWLSWRFLIPADSLNEAESSVMQAAGRRFIRQAATAMGVLLAITALVVFVWIQNSRRQQTAHVRGLINDLLGQEISEVPGIVRQLKHYQGIGRPELQRIVDDSSSGRRDKLRATLGLSSWTAGVAPELWEAIRRNDCTPQQLGAIVQVLSDSGDPEIGKTNHSPAESGVDPRSRFRETCAEILLGAGQGDWSTIAPMIADVLRNEPTNHIEPWIEILTPAGNQLVSVFQDVFSQTRDARQAMVMAQALFRFESRNEGIDRFAQLLGQANEFQFDAILTTIENNDASNPFVAELQSILTAETDRDVRTNLSIALLRLGNDRPILDLYAGSFESPPTILAITRTTPSRVRFQTLRELYEHHSVASTENVNLRRSVLQAIALHAADVLDPQHRSWLEEIASRHVVTDRDGCCFSTAELMLGHLEIDTRDSLRQQRKNATSNGILGNILINDRQQAFSILDFTSEDGQSYQFAISTTETTNSDMHDFWDETGFDVSAKTPGRPYQFSEPGDFVHTLHFCNWLSRADGLSADDLCYPDEIDQQVITQQAVDTGLAGYRIPTVAEWVFANESSRVLEGLEDRSVPVLLQYAWAFENSGGQVSGVARLLPNAAGLFDSFGNVQEICQKTEDDELIYLEMGRTIRVEASAMKVDRGLYHNVINPTKTLQGFRLVRTLPD